MDNLVIGNTSQLSNYFPEDYTKVSSRNIDYDFILSSKWKRAFLCFAEQRTFLRGNTEIFFDVNYSYTIDVINKIRPSCDKIYFYSTMLLWNAYDGAVDLSMPFKYNETPYIKSKEQITNCLMHNFKNITVLFPCNFNSVFRKEGFLFKKIFDSIINRKQITIGNTHFYREMVHPRYVVKESLNTTGHKMIGSGYAIHVNEFIRELYNAFDLDYESYVVEDIESSDLIAKRNIYYTKKDKIGYTKDDLLKDTVNDLVEFAS
jgi:hypothetical protein